MDSTTNSNVEVSGGLAAGLLLVYFLVLIAIYVVAVIGLWKMYAKAGKPGWAAIIPVYNWWVWIEMIGRPRWWFWIIVANVIVSFIPIINLFAGIPLSIFAFVLFLLACLDMAKCFGKGTGYGIGLWLLSFVFMPILGFGDAQYVGPVAAGAGAGGQTMAPPPAPPIGGQPMTLGQPAPLGQPMPLGQPVPLSPPPPPPPMPTPTPPPAEPATVAEPAMPAEPVTQAEPATPAEPVTQAEPATPAPPESPAPPTPPVA